MSQEEKPRPRIRDLLKVGDRVQHYGTREWATIEEILPREYCDGSAELVLLRERRNPLASPESTDKFTTTHASWATYHLGAVELHPSDVERFNAFVLRLRMTWKKCPAGCTSNERPYCHCQACGATGDLLCEKNGYCYRCDHAKCETCVIGVRHISSPQDIK